MRAFRALLIEGRVGVVTIPKSKDLEARTYVHTNYEIAKTTSGIDSSSWLDLFDVCTSLTDAGRSQPHQSRYGPCYDEENRSEGHPRKASGGRAGIELHFPRIAGAILIGQFL